MKRTPPIKNYDKVLQDYRHLPINAFNRDLNGTRISTVFNAVKSCLRFKEVMKVHCAIFDTPSFLTEDEWKYGAKIEAILHKTSIIHNGLSRGSFQVIDADT